MLQKLSLYNSQARAEQRMQVCSVVAVVCVCSCYSVLVCGVDQI